MHQTRKKGIIIISNPIGPTTSNKLTPFSMLQFFFNTSLLVLQTWHVRLNFTRSINGKANSFRTDYVQ